MNNTTFLYLIIEMKQVSAQLWNIELHLGWVPFIQSIQFREDLLFIIPGIHSKNSVKDIVFLRLALSLSIVITSIALIFDKILDFTPFSSPFVFIQDIIEDSLKCYFRFLLLFDQVDLWCMRISCELKQLIALPT